MIVVRAIVNAIAEVLFGRAGFRRYKDACIEGREAYNQAKAEILSRKAKTDV